jgi:hypothetical protein
MVVQCAAIPSKNKFMRTLSNAMTKLREKGYESNFEVNTKLELKDSDSGKKYVPAQVDLDRIVRFEGRSNPADMSVLYALSTHDGNQGLLVDAYGTYGSSLKTKFIQSCEEKHVVK